MSWQPAEDPKPGDRFSCDAIETIIVPRARDIGGFEVRRALPSAQRQMVGPFISFSSTLIDVVDFDASERRANDHVMPEC